MRLFVLVLAILLLPVRGWLGDAMALEPVQAKGEAVTVAVMPHGMHDALSMSEAKDAPLAAASDSQVENLAHDCQSTCNDCQLCHSIAVAVWPDVLAMEPAPRAIPALLSIAFASAEPVPGLKPPIS
ncbi:hypothetical protein BH11PSE13_BH11PSE13_41590 [soil metagenome]